MNNEIVGSEDYLKAKKWTIQYLSRKNRTSGELINALKKRSIHIEIIDRIIQECVHNKWIDDELYANNFIHDALKIKKKGKQWIKQALIRKGIDKEVIELSLGNVDDSFENQIGLEAALKKWNSLKPDDKFRSQKLFQYLIRKGFSVAITKKVMTHIHQVHLETDDSFLYDFNEQ